MHLTQLYSSWYTLTSLRPQAFSHPIFEYTQQEQLFTYSYYNYSNNNPKGLLDESRKARVFMNFINWPYIDQAIPPKISTTNFLKFHHNEAHLILIFKIPFMIFKF